jgi:SAM-dependent methyltransferase
MNSPHDGTKPNPPRIGSAAERRRVVECLTRAEFSEAAVCAFLDIPDLDALEGQRTRRMIEGAVRDSQALLIQLFILGGAADAADVNRLLKPDEAAAFLALDLIGPTADERTRFYSPLRLVPISYGGAADRTLFIASDRTDTPDGSRFEPFADIVFSGHNPLTRQFLRLLPTSSTGTVLDLCSGTGIGALVAETTAQRVIAVDITERCTEFARFNCWLNGKEHVEVRRGDLYEPVHDERFDRILAHPPYVPALSERLIYRDAGETGDRLLRRIIEELPNHLSPAGTFHALSIGMDTVDGTFEARVRRWLGASESAFDIVFAFGSSMSPEEFAQSLVTRASGAQPGDLDRWLELFTERQVREVVYGALVLKRVVDMKGAAQTRRVVAGPSTGPGSFERLFEWFDWMRRPGLVERVLSSRLILAEGAQLDTRHVIADGQFVPDSLLLRNDHADFKVQLKTDGWVIAVLSGFNGRRTVAEVFDEANRIGAIPKEFFQPNFVDLVCLLVERGFLLISNPPAV